MRSVRFVVVLVVLVGLAVPAVAHAAPEWRSMTGGVGWDPCAAPVVLRPNDAGAYSATWKEDLSRAASTINAATGRTLLKVGSTTTSTDKDPSPPVYFTDLAGSTAGTAYISWSVDGSGTPRHITRGSVALDTARFRDMPDQTTRVGVLVHEIGHLLGLAHVGDAHEAMSNGFLFEGGVGDGTSGALRSLYAVACGTHPRISDGPHDWQLPDHEGYATTVRNWNVATAATNVIELGVSLAAASVAERGAGWADRAVVCRDDVFADCLAGAALAGSSGPVLFVPGGPSGTVPPSVLGALTRSLEPGGTVYVLGGNLAVSDAVYASLSSTWPTERLFGAGRTETAVSVAGEVVDLNGRKGAALIARDDNPADAVTAGAAAGRRGLPILLSNRGNLSAATADALGALGVDRTLLLGGVAALDRPVEEALRSQGRNPQRVAGATRSETSVAVARHPDLGARTSLPAEATFVGLNGYHDETWALALSAAPLAAHLQAPVLLTRPSDVAVERGTHGEPAWYLSHLDGSGGVDVTYIYVGAGRWASRHAANSFRSYLFIGR